MSVVSSAFVIFTNRRKIRNIIKVHNFRTFVERERERVIC